MQSLTHNSTCCVLPQARSSFSCQRTRSRRASVVVQAEENPRGYVRKDSAGQENVYSQETKSYVKGSSGDGGDNKANNTIAGIAAGLAVLAIVAGLLVTRQQQPTNLTDIQAELGTYKTLSEYAQAFSS